MKRILVSAAVAVLAVGASAQWFENFDSYNAGDQLHGMNGWEGWDGNPGAGALVSDAQSSSAPNSVDIVGASDLVQVHSGMFSGVWLYTTEVYLPTKYSGESYFILMNTYTSGGNPKDWSLQMVFDSGDGMIHNLGGSGNVVTETQVAYDLGVWRTIDVLIDLDNNTHTARYNGQVVVEGEWYGGAGGQQNIGATDLFANNANSVFYDNFNVQQVPEPATIAGLSIGLLALLRRRRN
ncbi:MAG: PEP-CTERM sorting domain-containing protein [Armatimonadetes bacterium]|nr:PEP-CTERM sorting domain-containing protein [Armatimonadota bacterium]